MKNAVIFTVLLALAGCADVGSARVEKACAAKETVSPGVCKCIGEKSKGMDKQEQEIVIAMLSGEDARDAIKKYPMGAVAGAGQFMAKAMASCMVDGF